MDFRAILNRVALERSTTLNTIELDECYEWWNFRPDNVLQVCEKIKEYEAYFTDMSLNKNGLLKNYLASPLDNPLDELLLYNPSSCFKVCVNDLTGYGYAGCVNKQNRILAIDNLSANKKEVILHEMIHAHEILLEEKSILLRDALLLELYNKLKPIYPTLDQMIKHHANFYRYKQTVADYGEHDILFLLKSLELDDVLKVKPGTVFGYDMDISTI